VVGFRQRNGCTMKRVGMFRGSWSSVWTRKTRLVLNLILYPEKLKRDDAIKHFGDDYVLTRYEFCNGFDDEDDGPLYETPNGQLVHLEYRAKGISVVLQKNDEVHYISYGSRWIDSKCKRN